MSEPRKRRWFQIHFSSWIIFLLSAYRLTYANCVEYQIKGVWCFGWPMEMHDRAHVSGSKWDNLGMAIDLVVGLIVCLAVGLLAEWALPDSLKTKLDTLRPAKQFHIQTALLLSLIMGALMMANLSVREEKGFLFQGWPRVWLLHLNKIDVTLENLLAWNGLIFDLATALFMITMTWLISEFLIRRREARKQ